MNAFAYILVGLHVALPVFLWFASSKKAGLKWAALALAAAYIGCATVAPAVTPYLFIVEAATLVRLAFLDIFKTAGSSLSRHTERVFSKSFFGSIISLFLVVILSLCFLRLDLVTTAFYAWPAFFGLEYIARSIRSARTKAFLNRNLK